MAVMWRYEGYNVALQGAELESLAEIDRARAYAWRRRRQKEQPVVRHGVAGLFHCHWSLRPDVWRTCRVYTAVKAAAAAAAARHADE
jgi:hypothetical protein